MGLRFFCRNFCIKIFVFLISVFYKGEILYFVRRIVKGKITGKILTKYAYSRQGRRFL